MTVFVDSNHPVVGASSRGGLLYLTATGVQELETIGGWQERVSWVDLKGDTVTLDTNAAPSSDEDPFNPEKIAEVMFD